jgi:hypothetical protein
VDGIGVSETRIKCGELGRQAAFRRSDAEESTAVKPLRTLESSSDPHVERVEKSNVFLQFIGDVLSFLFMVHEMVSALFGSPEFRYDDLLKFSD